MIPTGVHIALSLLAKEIQKLKEQNLVVAIDGYSSSGKSTISRDLARTLDYTHVDSGAMYRAVTLHCLDHGISTSDEQAVTQALSQIDIRFRRSDEGCLTLLNGQLVESEIRTMRVSSEVSNIAAISSVRTFLVQLQRGYRSTEGIVMDGRDIGTVVFPDADVKLFISATIEKRTQRRHLELTERGIDITSASVEANLLKRDYIDSHREDSPLRQAEDAILLDTSGLTRTEQLNKALELIIRQTS